MNATDTKGEFIIVAILIVVAVLCILDETATPAGEPGPSFSPEPPPSSAIVPFLPPPFGAAVTIGTAIDSGPYYRGGDWNVRPIDVKTDKETGDVLPGRGVSVFDDPGQIPPQYGPVNQIGDIPPDLTVIQRGKNLNHFEVTPVEPMPYDQYGSQVRSIPLTPIEE